MKSQTLGKSTSQVEVLNIDIHGLWLFVKGKEYFLGYNDFPWFRDARVSDIFSVELHHDFHLRWPSLDIDLDLTSIENLSETPLIYN
ncbi:MAG: DUF2442 domain-containing protein [Thermodesulfobacteriota bacterium]